MPREELVIFVERFMHFANVWTVYSDLLSGRYSPTAGSRSGKEPFPNMNDTMMFLLYAVFYSLIEEDSNSLNAFRVWRQYFPQEEEPIAAVEAKITPFAEDLKRFRNRIGFHGSRTRVHESSGFDLFAKHSGTAILTAMADFKQLGVTLLAKDSALQKARRT